MTVNVDNEKLLAMYKNMVTIRLFETQVSDLFAAGNAHLQDQDYITSTHRGHGHLIAKGGDLNKMMAELYGKQSGYCKGKGGSMHIADVDLGILGANGIVGGGPPIAAGAAFGIKYQGGDGVVVCFFGDAASNQGTFHEGLNLASVWKLPVIFVCENNLYGISVSQARHQNISDVADRSNAYDIPGVVVDGNDVMAVYEAAGEAIKRARLGKGPSLIECKTYRWRGHFEGDPTPYRPQGELEAWMKKDPIPRFEAALKEMGVLTDESIAATKKEIGAKVEAAVKFSEESPWPALSEILDDVYTGDPVAV